MLHVSISISELRRKHRSYNMWFILCTICWYFHFLHWFDFKGVVEGVDLAPNKFHYLFKFVCSFGMLD